MLPELLDTPRLQITDITAADPLHIYDITARSHKSRVPWTMLCIYDNTIA